MASGNRSEPGSHGSDSIGQIQLGSASTRTSSSGGDVKVVCGFIGDATSAVHNDSWRSLKAPKQQQYRRAPDFGVEMDGILNHHIVVPCCRRL